MENQTNTTGLAHAICRKLAEAIDGHSLGEILTFVGLSFLAGIITDAAMGGSIILRLLEWRGGTLPTFGTVSLVVFNCGRLSRSVRGVLGTLKVAPAAETIEGIPTVELLDHLFTAKSFKRDDVKLKFSVPQYRVEDLGRKLQDIGVLIVGPNNSKVLNPEFSRQDAASILKGKSSARELEPLFRRDGARLTSEPSAKAIEARVEEALTPPLAPGFSTRVLADRSHATMYAA
jgi:hypothetical protein